MGQSYYQPIHLAEVGHTLVESVVYRQEAGHSKMVVERCMLAEVDIEGVED